MHQAQPPAAHLAPCLQLTHCQSSSPPTCETDMQQECMRHQVNSRHVDAKASAGRWLAVVRLQCCLCTQAAVELCAVGRRLALQQAMPCACLTSWPVLTL